MYSLSIITINYNNIDGLQKTFKSVFEQTYTAFEYIIIDGGSNDGSKELIEANANKLTYWISEADRGVYHAMNKGITASTGEYVVFLNSGDVFHDEKIIDLFSKNANEADILYGDVLKTKSEFQDRDELKIIPKNLSFNFFYNDTLPHQCCFIKRELFELYGQYDENLKITADWAFFLLAICKHNRSYKHLDHTIANYDTSGVSSDPKHLHIHTQERALILNTHFNILLNDYLHYNKLLYYSKFTSFKRLSRIIDRSDRLHKLSNFILLILNKIIRR